MSGMREDHFTNTVEDAAAYERDRGTADYIDDRPTAAEDRLTSEELENLAPGSVPAPWDEGFRLCDREQTLVDDALQPIRDFHKAWGDAHSDDLDPVALWEDLGRLLGVGQ